jgi:hypothetical protein
MINIHTIIKKQIIFFYFCLTRKHNEKDKKDLSTLLDDLLYILKLSLYECDETVEIEIYISYFILLYKLVAYTRDICVGKGERDLTYIMIEIWYKYFPVLAKNMLKTITEIYGSWKDLKYYCKYTKHEIMIDYSIELWNNQLEKDLLYFSTEKISNVSKWIPREKSAFRWLFKKSAIDWYSRFYYEIPINININIIKKEYRQIISSFNHKLNTPQIKETQNKWNEIIPENISLTTKSKQYNTFININNSLSKERIQCKDQFETFFSQNKKENEKEKKMKSFHLGEYIKHPHLQNQKYWNEIKKDILQTRKKDSRENIYILPIVNISIVDPEEYIDAIAIGCMFTEISALQNRMIVYDNYVSWINLSNDDLETKINKIKQKTICKGSSSSILNAISLLTKQNMDLTKLYIVIISDFSMESFDLDSKIKEMFGVSPKIIYWNVGSKIPIFHLTEESVYISGSSSSTIKYVYENIDNENMIDTYSLLNNIINQDRYLKVEEYFKNRIMND